MLCFVLRSPKPATRQPEARVSAVAPDTRDLTLDLEGMTCAACAARIEKKLNRLDGVTATVNYALEQATVHAAPAVTVAELVTAVESAGYCARLSRGGLAAAAEPGRPWRLIVAAVLAVPIVVLGMVSGAHFDGWEWVAFGFATPIVFWAGLPFHRAAFRAARHGSAAMDTLISIGTLSAWTWSTVVLIGGLAGDTYFEVAAAVTVLILLGRTLEGRAKRRSSEAVRLLLELGPREVTVVRDGVERVVPATSLNVGDLFVARPGERVAADGTITHGESALDRAVVTGESVPEDVAVGDAVLGGTLNTYGRLIVRASGVGADTTIAQIARLVAAAQTGKAPVQRLADRVASVFVPAVIVLAIGTLGAWLASGASAGRSFTAAVAVLIIACPCALGLATPTALLVGTGRGAQLGLLVKGPEMLERTRRITTVVLDKTGTVTTGQLTLAHIEVTGELEQEQVMRLVGAVEAASEHPVGRAIAAAAREQLGSLPEVVGFRNLPGIGVEGVVEGCAVSIHRTSRGITAAIDGRDQAIFAVADTIKPEAAAAIKELRALGLTPVLLTGDTEQAAAAVASALGIEHVLAEVLPDRKAAEIVRLQEAGEVVAMVGDGVNDAPALASADLGIAIGTGADIALEASDLTVVSGDLLGVADAIRLARRTLATIRGNLFWAFAYNVAALPLAAAGLLSPVIAAGAMAGSSLFVVGNSLRLRGFQKKPLSELRPGT